LRNDEGKSTFILVYTLTPWSQIQSQTVWFPMPSFPGTGRICAVSCILQNTKYSCTCCTQRIQMTMNLLRLFQSHLL
jgi:hypothetical protein